MNIGTSGFMISQKVWFSFLCLNCIEINSTFYRLPSEKSIENWNNFPRNVSIVLKVSKYITQLLFFYNHLTININNYGF